MSELTIELRGPAQKSTIDVIDAFSMVYREFERRALQVARFREHYSGYTILEVMRHDSAIGELHGEWKLNNSHCADLCRLFALCNPNHAGLFEFRARKVA